MLNGDAKKAFVLELGGEEEVVDVDVARSENVDDSDEVEELDDRSFTGTLSWAMLAARRGCGKKPMLLNVTEHTCHAYRTHVALSNDSVLAARSTQQCLSSKYSF